MILRRLKQEEKKRTRPLWERIFDEDSQAFVEYYYSIKTEDNFIYAIEKDGEIRSMLQLNPYVMRAGSREFTGCYIVGVATDRMYRGQGFMTELLRKSVRDMYAAKMPFTFLMPAAEEIYYPHNFRYIYAMDRWKAESPEGKETALEDVLEYSERLKIMGNPVYFRQAEETDCGRLADFAGYVMKKKYQVYAKHTEGYYNTLLKELESQAGGILIAEKDGEIRGTIQYTQEQGFEVREPLAEQAFRGIFKEAGLAIKRAKKKKPIIMARLLCVEELLAGMRCTEEMDLRFWLVDPVIRENNKLFMIKGNPERMMIRTKPSVRPEKKVQMISVDALTSILFGYKNIEEVQKEEKETFSEEFIREVSKLEPLSRILLNEIV